MAENITTYNAAVSYLNDTPRFTEKHTIEQTKTYLRCLGSPEGSFRVVHTAGSNGKGSVCTAVASVLRCAGFSVGLFTSPHLVTTRERFVIDGEMITEEQFLEDFQQIRQMLRQHPAFPHPTYFEYLFLMAMLRFRKAGVDAAVLETGLGGRLDATNAVEKPDVTVITSIGLEHTQYLGDTIAQIAAEKAGIIKPHVPVIYDAGDPEAADVIRRKADVCGAPAYPVYPEQFFSVCRMSKGIAFTFRGYYDQFRLQIPYEAEYQVMNAALAASAAEQFLLRTDHGQKGADLTTGSSAPLRRAAIEAGISRSVLPGRMEKKADGIILDGAHNPPAIDAFERAVRQLAGSGQVLLFGCLKDKDYKKMVYQIGRSGLWDEIVATGIDTQRAVPVQELADLLAGCTKARIHCEKDPQAALAKVRSIRGGRRYVFAAGSLYLIGRLEEYL